MSAEQIPPSGEPELGSVASIIYAVAAHVRIRLGRISPPTEPSVEAGKPAETDNR